MSSQDDYSTGPCPNNQCFDIIVSKKTVTVPCTRNICELYTVKVPKMKPVTVNKQVPYTDYEFRRKQVPYQYLERQTVVRKVPTCRTIPVTKNVCTTVGRKPLDVLLPGRRSTAKKKCPRTVYVTKKCCEPRQFCKSVLKAGWKTIDEKVPVQKVKNVPEVRYKTEYVPKVRRRTRQVTKMVTKTVPVYKIVPKPPASPGKDRVIETVRAPEASLALPAQKVVQTVPTVQSNAVWTSAVPINAGVAAYNPGYYPREQEVAYTPTPEAAHVSSPQVANIDPGPSTWYDVQSRGLSTDLLPRNGSLERSLVQEVQVDSAMTNDMAAMGANYESGYDVQETGRYDSGDQGKPSFAFETPVRNTESSVNFSNGARAGTEFGQRRR